MPVSNAPLGMNARNFAYIRRYNRKRYKLIADDKLQTKERLIEHGVPTNDLLAKFVDFNAVRKFDWTSLPKEFVVKPSHGYGGKGIVIVQDWDGTQGKDLKGNSMDIFKLEAEIFGALDGAHALNNLADQVFIEERVHIHTFFKKLTTGGVPDIRVIVFNKIPVMAMLRLPTTYSNGKANLHLGAVGIGIDIRTGITTYGVSRGDVVENIPGTKTKVRGLKIPVWKDILNVATKAQVSSKLGFVGIDIVLDEKKGPLVLEINARPGLSIQVANQDSLRTRLERVTSMDVPSVEKGVELGQTLFADPSLTEVQATDDVLGIIERVTLYGDNKKKTVRAKIDTGAYRTSIASELVHELGLDKHDKVVHVRAGSGQQKRRTAKIKFKLKNKEIKTIATYTERGHMRFPMIVGRRDLKGFMVDPSKLPEGIKVK
ncbi:ATP-grasp domain-containing protein [Candidatus Pacebacteria bacterium]|nr:ATP-grasp domain-containing protein [Candidatus Paceibacterota bacterium]